jgi:hypothetical protein
VRPGLPSVAVIARAMSTAPSRLAATTATR